MEKNWVLKKRGDIEVINRLQEELKISFPLANLLAQRNITNFKEAHDFFRPNLSQLHDPFLMKDMEKAIERIKVAIDKKEKIMIYGDYDVDGTSAVALVYSFFKEFYESIDYYIPDRYNEGYGISFKGIDYAKENNFGLVIALDCGIKAIEQIKYANSKKIDFIIGDHHRPGNELPAAHAILNPKRNDSTYPYLELSGCGIGFKLVQAFALKNNISFDKVEEYIDLVAISIAADIVPITGENRVLAFYGLKKLNSNPRPGIEAILKFSNIHRNDTPADYYFKRQLTINDLVFLVGPRINAAGRKKS